MESYGIPTAPYTLAKSAEEAASAAEKLGYPVVMKVVSPQIIHKSDYGAVRVGLQNAAAAREAYDAILASCREKAPGAEVHGVLVTRMVSGQEIIAGLVHDRQFGPTLMVGLGGVFVEILKDVNFWHPAWNPEGAAGQNREFEGISAAQWAPVGGRRRM